MFHKLATLVLLGLLQSAATRPTLGAVDVECLKGATTYNITSQGQYVAAPTLVTGVSVQGCDGCSISESTVYSVTVTIDVGASLGLDLSEIVHLGGAIDVSISTTNGESIGANLACPAGAVCGLSAQPTLYRIQGFQHQEVPKCQFEDTTLPYDVSFPVLVQGASPAGQAVVEYSACFAANGVPAQPIPGYDYPDCPPANLTH